MTDLDDVTPMPVDDAPPAPRPKRGFAALTPERRAELSRKGGQAAHAKGTAHKWDTEAARTAGRKGGAATRSKRSAV